MSLKKAVIGLSTATVMSLSANVTAKDALHNTVWKVVDEKGKSDALIKISKEGQYFVGRLHKNLSKQTICTDCKGKYKDKSLLNVALINKVKAQGAGKYGEGTILDPTEDKTYKVRLELIDNNQKLKVRGYLGISLLGRTQTWIRTK